MQSTMLISLPSSGSDWLAGLLADVNPELRSDPVAKEFFNPVCNPRHYVALKRVFGCELVDCCRNLAIPYSQQQEAIEAAFERTWKSESLNFTKENFAYRKIGFFDSHFSILVLVRSARHTFPPERLRVLCWYDAMFQSFVDFDRETGDTQLGPAISFAVAKADTLLKRAVAAHSLALAITLDSAARRGIPILNWSLLAELPLELLDRYLLERLPESLRPEDLAAAVVRTRGADTRQREEAYEATGVEAFRWSLVARLPEALRSHMLDEFEPDGLMPSQRMTSKLEVA